MTKLMKKQITTIIVAVIIMIAIGVIANYLKINGFGKLFTIRSYQEAFKVTDYDRFIVKIFASALEAMVCFGCYVRLQYNKEIDDIEKEEEEFMKEVYKNG